MQEKYETMEKMVGNLQRELAKFRREQAERYRHGINYTSNVSDNFTRWIKHHSVNGYFCEFF